MVLTLIKGGKSYQPRKRHGLKLIEKDYRSSFDFHSTKENYLVTTVPIMKMKNARVRGDSYTTIGVKGRPSYLMPTV